MAFQSCPYQALVGDTDQGLCFFGVARTQARELKNSCRRVSDDKYRGPDECVVSAASTREFDLACCDLSLSRHVPRNTTS
jgi:hypothetical protein